MRIGLTVLGGRDPVAGGDSMMCFKNLMALSGNIIAPCAFNAAQGAIWLIAQ